jgi:PKD repeat protein
MLLGGTEYTGDLRITGSKNTIDPPATKVSVADFPVDFDITEYRPGGSAAEAAGEQYYDGTTECAADGKWELHVHGTEIPTGLHYVPCDVVISASAITGSFTLVAEGTIKVAGSSLSLGPAFVDGLLLFSNSGDDNAISIDGAKSTFDGLLVAPLGGATLAGSDHRLRCAILAQEIAVKGSKHFFGGDPACTPATENAAPAATDDQYATDEDLSLSIAAPGVLGNDADPDGDALVASVVSDVTDGTLTLEADGSFTYTPHVNFHGVDSFIYLACDSGPLCDTADVTIAVAPVNDAPVAAAGPDQTVTAGDTVVLDGSGSSDLDGDLLTFGWALTVPAGSVASLSDPAAVSPTFAVDVPGEYTIVLTVDDGNGGSDTDTVVISATAAPNTPPVAESDAYATDEDVPLSVAAPGVLDNDTDVDGDSLTAAVVVDVTNGLLTLNLEGSFVYTPDADFYGEDLFTYVANDGVADSNIATVTITVDPVNDPPVADANGPYTGSTGVAVSFNGSGSFDLDGTIVSYAWDFGDSNTGIGMNPGHTYLASGLFSVTLTVTDDGGLTDTVSTTADIIAAPNTAPVADAGPDQSVTVGDTVSLDGSGSSDTDSDPLTFLWALTVPAGSASSLSDPTAVSPTFVPDLPGDYTIELTVDDGNGGTATDTVTVTAARIGMTISLVDSLVGVGRTTDGTITLDNPAPPGGITVTLSLDSAIATVDPTDVPIAEGATEGTFVLAGVAVGATTITGSSPATETATADIQVTDSLISIDDIPIIAPDESADLPVSITKPAPPGGLTITLESLDPTIAITDPTVFVPEGLYVPTSNPQITGVAFGTTQIKATALAFGPDVRDVTVALTVTLTPDELDIPEFWTKQVTAQLSGPAPTGGVTVELSLDDPLATIAPSVFILEGQTLSGPIDITGGTTLGTTTLRGGGPGLAEGTSTINVIDTPDVWLSEGVSSYPSQPIEVGFDLQRPVRAVLEVLPPGPVDVVVSAPPGSGVLFSASRSEVGSESLLVATGLTSIRTSSFYLQGTIQGDDVDDDVPITIDVFDTGTTNPAGYEQADRPTNIDIGPSGFAFTTANDLAAPTFPNTEVPVVSWLLYDGEAGIEGNYRVSQEVRAGHIVTIDPTNSDPTVGVIVSPAILTGDADAISGGTLFGANAIFDGLTPGTTTLGITQPPGHTTPANRPTTRTVNVDAPDVWLNESGSSRIPDEDIGRDLQVQRRVRLEVAPPAPGVDVTIEVVDPTVALISTDPTVAGSGAITFPLVTGTSTPPIYVQGLTLDQGTELRITAPGYDQWITTVQVVESGFYIWRPSGDFTTTTLASNTPVDIRPATLDALQQVDEVQEVRGGTSPSVDVLSSDPSVGVITISPLVFTGNDDYLSTAFDPIAVGTAAISITQPPGFTPPAGKTSVVATVTLE